jgi:hypothetical protein
VLVVKAAWEEQRNPYQKLNGNQFTCEMTMLFGFNGLNGFES